MIVCLALVIAAPELAVELSLTPKAQVGEHPSLEVVARRPVKKVTLELRGDGILPIAGSAGPLARGARHRFRLPLGAPGRYAARGQLRVLGPEGSAEMPLEVELELLERLRLEVSPEDLDLSERWVKVTANRALVAGELEVLGDDGRVLAVSSERFSPDTSPTLRWPGDEGRVFRISVRGEDDDGFFAGIELFPWRVEVPHEDVAFASGSADIPPDEAPKLKSSLEELQAALRKYGKLASGVSVFVAGHTDTVGDAASNRELSERRARAIGRWFRKAGLRAPVFYAGFGESQLRVVTADDTDEPRNRRAEYLVAIEPPTVGGRSVAWRPLR